MDTLRVRVYNVRFGDAILIAVPDAENGQPKLRHILIDVGNALSKEGGKDFVFKPILEDIRAELAGAPIDLYIMTHEHMDHIQGLFYGEQKEALPRLPVNFAWLTASSEPGYYDRDWPTQDENGNPMKTPRQHLDLLEAGYQAIAQFAEARKNAGEPVPPIIQALLLNNNPRNSADCVAYLRQLAPDNTHYIHRGIAGDTLAAMHPFELAKLEVFAPEENTAVYYSAFRPLALGVVDGSEDGSGGGHPQGMPVQSRLVTPLPPPGVDAGAFYRLVEARRNGFIDNLLAIDHARNNSSIVFCLEWQGWRLLFAGDAELRSWQEMDKRVAPSPVHFLKISHHASHNGTPDDELLEKWLPVQPADARDRVAVASTFPATYSGIPHQITLDRLEARGVKTCMVFEELGDAAGDEDDAGDTIEPVIGYLEFSFPADGLDIGIRKQVLALDG